MANEGTGGQVQPLTETDLSNGVAAIRGDAIQMYSYLSTEGSQFAFEQISQAMTANGLGGNIDPNKFYPQEAVLKAFRTEFPDVDGMIYLNQFGIGAGETMFGGFAEQTGATGLDGFLKFVDVAMPGQYQEIHHGDPAVKVQGLVNDPVLLDAILPPEDRFDPKTGKEKLVFYSQTYYPGSLEAGILSGALQAAGLKGSVEMVFNTGKFRLQSSIPGENGKWREDLDINYYAITLE